MELQVKVLVCKAFFELAERAASSNAVVNSLVTAKNIEIRIWALKSEQLLYL